MEEFECLIYMDFRGTRKELIEKLASLFLVSPDKLGITSNALEIDVLTNDDDYFNEKEDKLENIYLTYPYILDVGSSGANVSKESVIKELSTLLKTFWEEGYPAVAECEYQELLPHNGEGMQHQLDARSQWR